VLEIEDGSRKVHEELSQEHLRAGSITYLRTTGNVLVRLLVRGADQSTLTKASRFLTAPPWKRTGARWNRNSPRRFRCRRTGADLF
jgi:hypothetical protein